METLYQEVAILNAMNRLEEKINNMMQELREKGNTPYLCGIDELAKYMGIGKTAATALKDRKEIPYSQRGRLLWFQKADVEKFIQRNRVK